MAIESMSENATHLLSLIKSICSPEEQQLIGKILLNLGNDKDSIHILESVSSIITPKIKEDNESSKIEDKSKYIEYRPFPVAYNLYGNFSDSNGFQNMVQGSMSGEFYDNESLLSFFTTNDGANRNFYFFDCNNNCLIMFTPTELSENYMLNRGNFGGYLNAGKKPGSSRRTFIVTRLNEGDIDRLAPLDSGLNIRLENGDALVKHFVEKKNICSKLMLPFYGSAQSYSYDDLEMMKLIFNVMKSCKFDGSCFILDSGEKLSSEHLQQLAVLLSKTDEGEERGIGYQNDKSIGLDINQFDEYYFKSSYNSYPWCHFINAAPPLSESKTKKLIFDYSNGNLCTDKNYQVLAAFKPRQKEIGHLFQQELAKAPQNEVRSLPEKVKYLNTFFEQLSKKKNRRR